MVTVEKLRPDIPDDLASIPGGTFGQSRAYLDLMKDCWAQVCFPSAQPKAEQLTSCWRTWQLQLATELLLVAARHGFVHAPADTPVALEKIVMYYLYAKDSCVQDLISLLIYLCVDVDFPFIEIIVPDLTCLPLFSLQSPDDRPDFESIIGRLRRMLAVETLARHPTGALHDHALFTPKLCHHCSCSSRKRLPAHSLPRQTPLSRS